MIGLKHQNLRNAHAGVIHGSLHNLICIALSPDVKPQKRLEAIDALGSEETPTYVAELLAALASREKEHRDIRIAAINGLRFIRKGSKPYKALQRLSEKSEEEPPIHNCIKRTLDEIHRRWVNG
jgi:HEAT repeat protein